MSLHRKQRRRLAERCEQRLDWRSPCESFLGGCGYIFWVTEYHVTSNHRSRRSCHGGVERAPREGANGTTESEKTNGPTGSTNETSDAEVSLAEVGVLPESFG
jgi:hypothetical protein